MTERDLSATPSNVVECNGIAPGIAGTRALIGGFRSAAQLAAQTGETVLLQMPGIHRSIHVMPGLTDQGLGAMLVEAYAALNRRDARQIGVHMTTLMCLGRDLRSENPDSLRAERFEGIVAPHA